MSVAVVESDLGRLLAKWRAVRGDSDRWELILAGDVVALGQRWEDLREEAYSEADGDSKGGPDFDVWLRRTFGHGCGVAYWDRRATAVKRIGEHARRRWHQCSAVWAACTTSAGVPRFDDVTLRRLDKAVGDEWRKRAGGDTSYPVLNVQTVMRLAKRLGFVEPTSKDSTCKRCGALELLLMEHGIEAP